MASFLKLPLATLPIICTGISAISLPRDEELYVLQVWSGLLCVDHVLEKVCLDVTVEVVAFYMCQFVENGLFLAFRTDVSIDEDGIAAVLVFVCKCPGMEGQYLIR